MDGRGVWIGGLAVALGFLLGACAADRWSLGAGVRAPHEGEIGKHTIDVDAVPYAEVGLSGPLWAEEEDEEPDALAAVLDLREEIYREVLSLKEGECPAPGLVGEIRREMRALSEKVDSLSPSKSGVGPIEGVAGGAGGTALIGALVWAIIKWRAGKREE